MMYTKKEYETYQKELMTRYLEKDVKGTLAVELMAEAIKVNQLLLVPSKESFKTLVMLEEQSSIDHMYSKISDLEHKDIYKSWKKIRSSLDALCDSLDPDPIVLGNGEVIHVFPTWGNDD